MRSDLIAAIVFVVFATTPVHLDAQAQTYVSRSETQQIARSTLQPAAPATSVDQMASMILKQQAKADIIQTLAQCQAFSVWFKENKNAFIPKDRFTEAREILKNTTMAVPTARSLNAPVLTQEPEDAAFELNVLISSLDK